MPTLPLLNNDEIIKKELSIAIKECNATSVDKLLDSSPDLVNVRGLVYYSDTLLHIAVNWWLFYKEKANKVADQCWDLFWVILVKNPDLSSEVNMDNKTALDLISYNDDKRLFEKYIVDAKKLSQELLTTQESTLLSSTSLQTENLTKEAEATTHQSLVSVGRPIWKKSTVSSSIGFFRGATEAGFDLVQERYHLDEKSRFNQLLFSALKALFNSLINASVVFSLDSPFFIEDEHPIVQSIKNYFTYFAINFGIEVTVGVLLFLLTQQVRQRFPNSIIATIFEQVGSRCFVLYACGVWLFDDESGLNKLIVMLAQSLSALFSYQATKAAIHCWLPREGDLNDVESDPLIIVDQKLVQLRKAIKIIDEIEKGLENETGYESLKSYFSGLNACLENGLDNKDMSFSIKDLDIRCRLMRHFIGIVTEQLDGKNMSDYVKGQLTDLLKIVVKMSPETNNLFVKSNKLIISISNENENRFLTDSQLTKLRQEVVSLIISIEKNRDTFGDLKPLREQLLSIIKNLFDDTVYSALCETADIKCISHEIAFVTQAKKLLEQLKSTLGLPTIEDKRIRLELNNIFDSLFEIIDIIIQRFTTVGAIQAGKDSASRGNVLLAQTSYDQIITSFSNLEAFNPGEEKEKTGRGLLTTYLLKLDELIKPKNSGEALSVIVGYQYSFQYPLSKDVLTIYDKIKALLAMNLEKEVLLLSEVSARKKGMELVESMNKQLASLNEIIRNLIKSREGYEGESHARTEKNSTTQEKQESTACASTSNQNSVSHRMTL